MIGRIWIRQWARFRIGSRFRLQPFHSITGKASQKMMDIPEKVSLKRKRPPTFLKKEIDEIQQKYPQHVLLVQVGMFYEIYDSGGYLDEIASLLDLRIGTHKNAISSEHRFVRFAGFPMSQIKNYLKPLISNGYTVAIVDQMEPDVMANYIKRRISRIITPGTVLDEDLETVDNNFLLAVYLKSPKARTLGLSWIDVSTGEFYLTKTTVADFSNQLSRIQPREVLLQKELLEHPIASTLKDLELLITPIDKGYYDVESKSEFLDVVIENQQLSVVSHPAQLLKNMHELEKHASIALLSYIRESFPQVTPAIRKPSESSQEFMKIDAKTFEALEIVETQRERSRKGSLLSVIEHCKTPSGKRLLRARLKAPSTNMEEIKKRLEMVQVFYTHTNISEQIVLELSKLKDVERALQKIHLQAGGPVEVSSIINSIEHIESVCSLLNELVEYPGCNVITTLLPKKSVYHLYERYQGIFDQDRKLDSGKLQNVGTISTGYCTELDDFRSRQSITEEKKLDRTIYLSNLFGIKCNLVFDSVAGPVVEIGKISEKTMARIQEIAKSKPELELIHSRKSSAYHFKDKLWSKLYRDGVEIEEQLLRLERSLLAQVSDSIVQESQSLIELYKLVAEIDISCTFGIFSRKNGYVCPEMVTNSEHFVEGGRHPVVEKFQFERGNSFVANDCNLSQQEQIWLLTGPNMGGKSTFLRQCAIISIMAQTGLFVPASFARLGVFDQVFSRIGSSDDLSANQSTFMVEMSETALILNKATKMSLIIMDEVGRGTSTTDGVSLALAILEHISYHNKSLCIFATHYHELARLLEKLEIPNVSYYKTSSVVDSKDQLTCLYQILPGVMDQSHGIQIAKHAGLPSSVIQNARKYYKLIDQ